MRRFTGEIIYIKLNSVNATANVLGKRYVNMVYCPECGYRLHGKPQPLSYPQTRRVFNDTYASWKIPLFIEGELWRSNSGLHDYIIKKEKSTIFIGTSRSTPWLWGFAKCVISSEAPIELVEPGYSIVQSCSRRRLYLYPLEYTPGEELDKKCSRCLTFEIASKINGQPNFRQGNLGVYSIVDMSPEISFGPAKRQIVMLNHEVKTNFVDGLRSLPCFRMGNSYIRIVHIFSEAVIRSNGHPDIVVPEGVYLLLHPVPSSVD